MTVKQFKLVLLLCVLVVVFKLGYKQGASDNYLENGPQTGNHQAEYEPLLATQIEYELLKDLNAPDASIHLIQAWEQEEGSNPDCFNPLNTTLDMGSGTSINSDKVKCYADYETGLAATMQTLAAPEYAPIVAAIQQNDAEAFIVALGASRWGTNAANVRAILGPGQLVDANPVVEEAPATASVPAPVTGGKADPIPDWPNHINAGFYTVNCAYWGFQAGCQHFGTDLGGDGEGTPVFAPYPGTVIECTDNGDGGAYIGKWIEYRLADGTVFLINHFRDIYKCTEGTPIEAGEQLGTMRGDANHVHVQVTEGGQLVDFVDYWNRH